MMTNENFPAFEQWANAACCGYVVKALNELGATPEQIRAVMVELHNQFENLTLAEAQEVYNNCPY